MEMVLQKNVWVFVLVMLWVLPWKAFALWTASKRDQKIWFMALILLNTFAILDIFYIFAVAKKSWKDIREVLKTKI